MSDFCFEFTSALNHSRVDYQLDGLIEIIENKLRMIPVSGFHEIIGKDLLHLTPGMIFYLESFYNEANHYYKKTIQDGSILKLVPGYFKPDPVKAIHCEMNNFTLSQDEWFMDVFSYSTPPSGVPDPFDWFTHFDFFALESFIITGYEALQEAYRFYNKNSTDMNDNMDLASIYCEILIILRLQEVVIKAIESTKRFSTVPFFVTVFNNDMVLSINLGKSDSRLNIVKNESGGSTRSHGRYSYFG